MTTQTLGWGGLLTVLIAPSPTHRKGNISMAIKNPTFQLSAMSLRKGKMMVALGSPLGSCCLLLARNPKMYFTAYTVEQQEYFFSSLV